jgi:hypothetical protein
MKNEKIKNMFLQGLLMATVLGTAIQIPDMAFAQLSTAANTSQNTVFTPILTLLSFASYVIGGILTIGGVMKVKAHTENAAQNPLQHAFGRVGAGATLLALPYLMGLASRTATETLTTTSSFQKFTF